MSVKHIEVRCEQLGMRLGTAANRLRKLVLFSVLERHGENVCFKCGKVIQAAKDLTIEHKIPWLHNGAELFWDLDNIAFSHSKCNKPDRFRGGTSRRKEREGFCWCTTCKSWKEPNAFSLKTTNWNGRNGECRECQKEYKDKVRYGIVAEPGHCKSLLNSAPQGVPGSNPGDSAKESSAERLATGPENLTTL